MKLIITKDYDQMSKMAADRIIQQLAKKPDSVLGLATGSSPIGMYGYLVDAYNKKDVDFSKAVTFNLDEYYGLAPDHPQSYRYFMDTNLFSHVNINKRNIHVPDGLCEDVEKFCEEYERAIEKAGGIDLQILGIGQNGHIGFNEPNSSLDVMTHLAVLTENTIDANSRFFDSIDQVPKKAITMGLGTIMNAKEIVMLASGKNKAKAIANLAKPTVNTEVPASMLHLHRNALVISDAEAASLIGPDSEIEIVRFAR